ncbi:hypothetical protein SAMN04488502_102304 [Dendrosporobacter quercicolus]|uniref:Uncharacterized protein n=1 Tax=Dendrosporobacter quercicolus TaxID=146817 RepID=A0A1G9QU63_9FIRM|nr:hypothetical protein [Dendrosporobacter quercicolus]SDM14552.1 hypothetical protein SAMN04488502_102304 [Dendrosporobacter quercicolus]
MREAVIKMTEKTASRTGTGSSWAMETSNGDLILMDKAPPDATGTIL